ncbi:MAG: choice-of-anchor D domain-containing protein [Gemmatimonadota bacterium]
MPAVTGALPGASVSRASADQTTVSQDPLRTGWDSSESAMAPSDVAGFTQLFKTKVTGQVWAAPLVLSSKNLVIAATEKDWVYGLDATTGAVKWSVKVGTAYAITSCNDLAPDVGITGGPVYDPATNAVYVMAQIKPKKTPLYSMFGINVDTGKITESIGVPLHPTNNAKLTFSGTNQLARPGLLLMNGWVYAAFGSHCDHKPYVGYVASFNVANPTSATNRSLWADETGSANNQAGIWQSGGGLMSDGPGRIFFTSGNGVSPADGYPATPPHQLAESIVRLSANTSTGALSAKDFFSPNNATKLDAGDTDWGSGAPVGLPSGTAAFPHIVVQIGKDGRFFLLNRDKLGGRNSTNSRALAVTKAYNAAWSHPAVFFGSGTIANGGSDYLYYVGKSTTMRILRFGANSAGKPTLSQVANTSISFGYSSGSPMVTSNGTDASSAVVWTVYSANSTGGQGTLEAFPATPEASGGSFATPVKPIKSWPIGTAAKFTNIATSGNRVYVGSRSGATASDGSVYGFGAPSSAAAVAPASQTTIGTTPVNSTTTKNVTLTANSTVTVIGVTASTGASGTPTQVGAPAPSEFTVHSASAAMTPVAGGTARPGAAATATPTSSALAKATASAKATSTATAVRFPVTLHKGEKLTVPVTFTPSSPGGATGTVSFATSAGVKNVPVAGTATTAGLYAPQPAQQFALVDDTGQFASWVPVGVQVPRQFDIVNEGTQPVTITSVSQPTAPYTVASGPKPGTVLQPGESTTTQILFTPTWPGKYPATYSVTGSDGTTATVNLTGVGLPPTGLFKASPAAVNFGSVPVGQQKTADITLTNTGNEPATVVTTSTLRGPFTRVAKIAPQLGINASYDVQAPITFTPRHKGTFTTTYTFTWTDVTGTHSVSVKITGKGV